MSEAGLHASGHLGSGSPLQEADPRSGCRTMWCHPAPDLKREASELEVRRQKSALNSHKEYIHTITKQSHYMLTNLLYSYSLVKILCVHLTMSNVQKNALPLEAVGSSSL